MNTLIRSSLAVGSAVIAATAMAACSGSDSGNANAPKGALLAPSVSPSPVDPALAGLVGSGCAGYAAAVPTGAGSIAGMAKDPVATAVGNNPRLTTLSAALSGKLNSKVHLAQTLNGREFTVFAPVDDAFSKLPAGELATLKRGAGSVQLVRLLTYHVVAGRIAPNKLGGTQMTVAGGNVKITGSGATLKVNGAGVICGGIRTANATLYLIDTVLAPPAD
jgi:uncharacterized surface protein with fasciclin (FAS1) repeats